MATLTPNQDAEVSIKENGVLTGVQDSVSITSTGTFIINITPPTGKGYILKGFDTYLGSGVYTIDNAIYAIEAPNGVQVSLGTVTADVGGFQRTNYIMGGLNINLSPGSRLVIALSISAWTSIGDVIARGVVNSYDV